MTCLALSQSVCSRQTSSSFYISALNHHTCLSSFAVSTPRLKPSTLWDVKVEKVSSALVIFSSTELSLVVGLVGQAVWAWRGGEGVDLHSYPKDRENGDNCQTGDLTFVHIWSLSFLCISTFTKSTTRVAEWHFPRVLQRFLSIWSPPVWEPEQAQITHAVALCKFGKPLRFSYLKIQVTLMELITIKMTKA